MLRQRRRQWPNIKTALGLPAMFEPSRTMHSKYTLVIYPMLGRSRWPNIKTALGLPAMFEPSRSMHSKYTLVIYPMLV